MANVCISGGLTTDAQGRLTIDAAPWPWPCDPGTSNREPVGISADGRLWAPPRQMVVERYFSGLPSLDFDPPDPGVNASGFSREFTIEISNPDPCRPLRGILILHIDLRCQIAPNAQIVVAAMGNNAWTMRNEGSSMHRFFNEFTRTIAVSIPAADTETYSWTVSSDLVQGQTGYVTSVSNTVRLMAVSN